MNTLTADSCDVLLLAAGYGKRLRPLTEKTPKPMLTVAGRPLIEWSLRLLAASGFERVFINLHYLGEQIRAFAGDGSKWKLRIEYSEEPIILDTGGAVKQIESRLTAEQLVIVNSDTLVGRDFSFPELLAAHIPGTKATLMVREDPEAERYGALRLQTNGEIVSLLDAQRPDTVRGEGKLCMFGGIHVISRQVIAQMPAAGSIFSITQETYRTLIRNGECLRGYQYGGYWSDVGTPERLAAASNSFRDA